MDEALSNGIEVVNKKVKPTFETVWKRVNDTNTVPEYTLIIWGSTVQDKDRTPVDLDVIIEYTDSTIDPEKENSIESIIKSQVQTSEFSYVDPLVKHRFETHDIIAKSRVSKVYSVTEKTWIHSY